MIRKMRTFVAALLLVPVLTLNANAFTVDTEGVELVAASDRLLLDLLHGSLDHDPMLIGP